MKIISPRNLLLIASLLMMTGAVSVQGANVTKLNTTTMVNGAADWSSAPLTTDVGEFGSTPSSATLSGMTLGGDLTLGGLQLDNNLAGPLTIASGNTLTLGASGIDMSAANSNAVFNCALTLGSAQPWTVASGRTLAIAGTSLSGGANLLTVRGAGNTTFSNTVAVSSTGGLTKTGGGTLQVNGATANVVNFNTSTVTVNGGLLKTINSAAGTGNIIDSTANLLLGGGAFDFAFTSPTSDQNFNNLTLTAGESVLRPIRSGGNFGITFAGTITRSIGATLEGQELDTGRTHTIFSSLAAAPLVTANGVAYLTLGEVASGNTGEASFNAWAQIDATHRLVFVTSTATTASSLGTAAQNANVAVAATTLAADATVASFRDQVNQATTINLGGFTFTTGGILITPLVATAGSVIQNGLVQGPAGQDLVVLVAANAATPVPFTISANIVDNAGSALTKGAPGTLILSGNNTFTTGVFINDGTIQLGNPGALNSTAPNAINFGGSGGFGTGMFNTTISTTASAPTLALAGNNVSVISLSTVNNLSGSAPVVKNANGSSVANATLTINGTGTTTFSGTIQDGTGGGTLGLTKSGPGTQTIGGTLSYSGLTTVSAGTLALTSNPSATSYSISGTLDATGISGGTLALSAAQSLIGGGTVNGTVTTVNGTILAPGSGTISTGGSGINTMGNLTLSGGSIVNFGLNAADPNNSQISVGAGTLTLPASGTVTINLYAPGTSTAFTAAGTYNLFQFTTGVNTNNLASRFTIGTSITGLIPTFGTAAGPGATTYLTLTLAASTAVNATWNPAVDANGNWSVAGNWNPANVPHVAGDAATLGVAAAFRTVALDANEAVGTLAMTNDNSFLIANSGNTLTFDNGGIGANLTVSGGTSNNIQTAVALNDNTAVTVNSGKSLTVSGTISNTASAKLLTVNGAGTTILSAANTYGPLAGANGTALSGGGTLQVGNNTALGAGDVNVTGSSTLKSGAPGLNIPNNIVVGGGVTATVDNNGNSLTLGVISGGGNLTKNSNGTLTMGSANTYAGSTTINGGVVSIATDGTAGNPGSLGTVPASATANNIILNGGDLLATASLTLSSSRGIGIGPTTGPTPGTALIDAAAGQTNTVNGILTTAGNTGANNLTVNGGTGTGTVVLGAASTFNGTTAVNAGILRLANSLALQNSTFNYSNNNNGTLDFGALTTAIFGGLSGTNNLNLTNASAAAVTLTLGNNNTTAIYSGVLGNLGSLIKVNGGTITIGSGGNGGANYTGTTTVRAGTLTLGGVGNMTATGNFSVSGIDAASTVNVVDSAHIAMSGAIYVVNDGGAGNPAACTLTVQNNASLSSASFSFGGTGSRTLTSSITVKDNASLTVSGNFDLNHNIGSTLQNNVVNLNGGTLSVSNFIQTAAGAGHNSTIHLNGGVLKPFASSTTFLPAFAGLAANVDAGGAIIDSSTFAITIAANLAVGTGGGLTKLGSGTLTLSGANTYTGLTTVSNGTLFITTALQSATESFLVNDGKTFGAVNNVGSGLSAQIVNLTLGNSSGATTLVFTNVADVNTPVINASGTATLNGNSTIKITDSVNLVAGNEYPLLRSSSIVTNSGTGFSLSLPAGVTGVLTNDVSSGSPTISLIVTAIAAIPPSFGSVVVSGSDLVLNASGGTPGGTWTLLSSTNLALPLASWTTVTTGNFDGSGNLNYTVTGALSSGLPQQFYILKTP